MKKFNLAMFSIAVLTSSFAGEVDAARLPLIENVGIVPVQWEGLPPESSQMKAAVAAIDAGFYDAVKKTHRFRLIHDELVAGRWSTPEGRVELVEQYELQGLASLSVVVGEDTVRMVARLLSPKMENYLSESEVQPRQRIAISSKEDIDDVLRNLVYRLFNRLPVDITVTSVQGRYLSLSGGSEQNLRSGDEFDVLRPHIEQIHPAEGSWVAFKSHKQGRVKIIDVKRVSSVGLIVGQSHEGAIGVGDGIKISDMEGRKFFKEISTKPSFKDSPDNIVVYSSKKPRTDAQPKDAKKSEHQPEPVKPADSGETVATHDDDQKPAEETSAEPEQPRDESAENSEGRQTDESGIPIVLAKRPKQTLDFVAGIDQWSVSGATSSSASLAPWLLNVAGARMRFPLMQDMDVEVMGNLKFGRTSDGSYMGLDGGGRLVYLMSNGLGFSDHFRMGGEAAFATLSVSGGEYGGYDLVNIGGFGGLEGRFPLFGHTAAYEADAALTLFGLGQIGYGGSKHSLGSALGLKIRGNLMLLEPKETFNWGGGVEIGTLSGSAGSSISLNDLKLLFLVRYHM